MIPLWLPKDLVKANVPQQFKTRYPTTKVIFVGTEINIEQTHQPELQKMTFSYYKAL